MSAPTSHSDKAILLLYCPDRKGIVAGVSGFLYAHGANILHADQHQDNEQGLFFMRVEWDLNEFDLARESFEREFRPMAADFQMIWQLEFCARLQAVAIFVSRHLHCLADLLYRYKAGELQCRIPLIISNHVEARSLAEFYSVPFHHIPMDPASKAAAEEKQLQLLENYVIDLVVLARYMQILSPDFVVRYPQRVINVHHSFLPAFTGPRPYRAAFERGVKLIGATSHYVTEVLDDGPIIEQDVVRVSHRDQEENLAQRGRDLERVVLARAVRWHLEHRVLCYGNKTVIFD